MANTKTLSLVLPRPVECPCGTGKLVPLLDPVVVDPAFIGDNTTPVWGNGYHLHWECTSCGKQVPKK